MPPAGAPGLGQTLLDSSVAQPLGMGLPPRRPDSQLPFGGTSVPPAPTATAAWGSAATPPQLPPLETATSRPAASSLIPGSPSLPGAGNASSGAANLGNDSLLGRGLPSGPLSPQPPPLLNLPAQENPGRNVPASGRSRPLPKSRKGSNVFMIGLAVICLGGLLAAGGWLFREPITEMVQRFQGAQETATVAEASVSIPSLPEPTLPDSDNSRPTAEVPSNATGGRFDPAETIPPQAMEPTPERGKTEPTAESKTEPMIAKADSPLAPELPKAESNSPPSTLVEVTTPATAKTTGSLTASSESAPASGSNSAIRMDGITPAAQPAADALMAFLKAENLEERLRYTLAPELMRPYMERYYSANPDGPILVDAVALVRHDPKPQIGGGAHAVFGLESKTWEYALPVMLEEQQGRFKVDWLSFVEFKDRLLEKFLQGYQEGAARFHVGITRTHYFEDKVPNASSKDAFRLSPAPPNPFTATVFIEKDSDLGRDLRDKIPWGSQVWAIVELEWIKLGNLTWVQLSGVPQLNWYSVPADAPNPRGLPMADGKVPTETQKAVPVGRGQR